MPLLLSLFFLWLAGCTKEEGLSSVFSLSRASVCILPRYLTGWSLSYGYKPRSLRASITRCRAIRIAASRMDSLCSLAVAKT